MSDSLEQGEPHPAALDALFWLYNNLDMAVATEIFASTVLEGNRLAKLCLGTLQRLDNRQPVSDRYLLGLAWTLRSMKEATDA